jgi:hypothetical protein
LARTLDSSCRIGLPTINPPQHRKLKLTPGIFGSFIATATLSNNAPFGSPSPFERPQAFAGVDRAAEKSELLIKLDGLDEDCIAAAIVIR